jgi:hypothetical protein
MKKRLGFKLFFFIIVLVILELSLIYFFWEEQRTDELPVFNDVTKYAGVINPYNNYTNISQVTNLPLYHWIYGPAACFGDYDNDGYLDLYIVNYGRPNLLYHNNGNGTFTDVTMKAGVSDNFGLGTGCIFADYDNDGDLDIFITNWNNPDDINPEKIGENNILYRNNGDGTFTDVTFEAGLQGYEDSHSAGAAWGDYDNDGDLDLFVANYGNIKFFRIPHYTAGETATSKEPSMFYRNNGDGTFTDVTIESGVKDEGTWALQPIWFDYNNDGFIDLFVATDIGISPLYRNNGDGTFTSVTKYVGLGQWVPGMGVDIGDIDNDGDLDIVQTNYGENYLWKSNGEGFFDLYLLDHFGYISMGVHMFDFDNDADSDIYIVNGYMGVSSLQRVDEPNIMLMNLGKTNYTDICCTGASKYELISEEVGLINEVCGRGATFGDYDNDGDVDIYVINANAPNVLFRNDGGNRNNWIVIRLKGSTSNSYGVGAKVKVITGETQQTKIVICGSSYLSGNSLDLEFGLGQYPIIDSIEVNWPSGKNQIIPNIAGNQIFTITEP